MAGVTFLVNRDERAGKFQVRKCVFRGITLKKSAFERSWADWLDVVGLLGFERFAAANKLGSGHRGAI